MTQIINLPALNTLTNGLFFPAIDVTDSNITKKVSLDQLVTLSIGPRGPTGFPGISGPTGPSGPSGPNANQTLNTSSVVTFSSLTVTNSSIGITFADGTSQRTAFRKNIRDLTEFSTGNISLTKEQITAPILTGSPTTSGRNLYLPTADSDLAGTILIVRNRSNTNTFNLWGGLANLATVNTNSTVEIACDGYTWFVV